MHTHLSFDKFTQSASFLMFNRSLTQHLLGVSQRCSARTLTSRCEIRCVIDVHFSVVHLDVVRRLLMTQTV